MDYDDDDDDDDYNDDDGDNRVDRRHANNMSFGASYRKATMLPPELLRQPDNEAEDAFWDMPDSFVGGVRPRRRRRFVRIGNGGGGGRMGMEGIMVEAVVVEAILGRRGIIDMDKESRMRLRL